MKRLILLLALLTTNVAAQTDQEIVDNYQARTDAEKICKEYIESAISTEKTIKLIQKYLGSQYEYNVAMNDYVTVALNIKRTCPSSNSTEVKNLTDLMVRIGELRQRILLGLE